MLGKRTGFMPAMSMIGPGEGENTLQQMAEQALVDPCAPGNPRGYDSGRCNRYL